MDTRPWSLGDAAAGASGQRHRYQFAANLTASLAANVANYLQPKSAMLPLPDGDNYQANDLDVRNKTNRAPLGLAPAASWVLANDTTTATTAEGQLASLLGNNSGASATATAADQFTYADLALVGVLISLILISIVGNCLVCVAICTDRRLRKLGNAFIVSLAIADLFVSCLVMTFALCNDLMNYWIFGEWFCDIWISFDIMCCTASILNLCAISLDRFIHIKDCLLYNQRMTRKVAFSAVLAIWFISALVSFVPINLGWHKPTTGAPLPVASNEHWQRQHEHPDEQLAARAVHLSSVGRGAQIGSLIAANGAREQRPSGNDDDDDDTEPTATPGRARERRLAANAAELGALVDPPAPGATYVMANSSSGRPLANLGGGATELRAAPPPPILVSGGVSANKRRPRESRVPLSQVDDDGGGGGDPTAARLGRPSRQPSFSPSRRRTRQAAPASRDGDRPLEDHSRRRRPEQPGGAPTSERNHKPPAAASAPTEPAQCMLTLTPTYAVVSSTISFYIPCIIMLGLYSKLFACARRHVLNIQATSSLAPRPISRRPAPPNVTNGSSNDSNSTKNNTYKMHHHQHHHSKSNNNNNKNNNQQQPAAADDDEDLSPTVSRATWHQTGTSSPTATSRRPSPGAATSGAETPAGRPRRFRSLWFGRNGSAGPARAWIKFGRLQRRPRQMCLGQEQEPEQQRLATTLSGEQIKQTKQPEPDCGALDENEISDTSEGGRGGQVNRGAASELASSGDSTSVRRLAGATSNNLGGGGGGGGINARARADNQVGANDNQVSAPAAAATRARGAGATNSSTVSSIVDQISAQELAAAAPSAATGEQQASHRQEREPFLGPSSAPSSSRAISGCAPKPKIKITTKTKSKSKSKSKPETNNCDTTNTNNTFTIGSTLGQEAAGLLSRQATCTSARSITFRLNLGARDSARSASKQQQQVAAEKQHNQMATHKAAVTLGIIMGTFLFCWVPFFCLNIIKAYCVDCIPSSMFRFFTWLGYANSALNPIIYGIHNSEFRNAFNRIFFKHLSIKHGRSYLNRRFSYDLRHPNNNNNNQRRPGAAAAGAAAANSAGQHLLEQRSFYQQHSTSYNRPVQLDTGNSPARQRPLAETSSRSLPNEAEWRANAIRVQGAADSIPPRDNKQQKQQDDANTAATGKRAHNNAALETTTTTTTTQPD